MDWMEVVTGLKKGKKFHRKNESRYIQNERGLIFLYESSNSCLGIRYMPFISDYVAKDWIEKHD